VTPPSGRTGANAPAQSPVRSVAGSVSDSATRCLLGHQPWGSVCASAVHPRWPRASKRKLHRTAGRWSFPTPREPRSLPSAAHPRAGRFPREPARAEPGGLRRRGPAFSQAASLQVAPARWCRVGAGRAARGGRGAHEAYPARERGLGAQFGRSGAGLSTVPPLDRVSPGRAGITVGRGSFIESSPLFGFDLDHHEALFAENSSCCARCATPRTCTGPASIAPRCRVRASLPAGTASAAGVDWRRRDAAVIRPRRHPRLAADARDHRRASGAIPLTD
jgi:hypothetical protein